MSRLVWAAAGAVACAVGIRQLRKAAETNPTARLAERALDAALGRGTEAVSALTARATSTAKDALAEYRSSSRERERELQGALLAETQGTEDELRQAAARRRAATGRDRHGVRSTLVHDDEFAGDEDILGYEF